MNNPIIINNNNHKKMISMTNRSPHRKISKHNITNNMPNKTSNSNKMNDHNPLNNLISCHISAKIHNNSHKKTHSKSSKNPHNLNNPLITLKPPHHRISSQIYLLGTPRHQTMEAI